MTTTLRIVNISLDTRAIMTTIYMWNYWQVEYLVIHSKYAVGGILIDDF